MSPTQQFRFGKDIESLALRQDANGTLFSQMDDITDIFPGALRFKPKRIAYYLNDVVEVVTATHSSSSLASNSIVSLSALSLYTHAYSTPKHLTRVTQDVSNQLLGRPMAALFSSESSIVNLQLQLELSTDQQSSHHQQLVEQFIHMVAQQNEMIAQ
ncbi:hypothetical protein F5H01DRAFT_360814 [Linnemannia elongata]|nr:hypothetical protein F5H01DRAFT_360814 [Linnemannia elongata]